MKEICEMKRCTGCAACLCACPVDAIRMEYHNGFQYPKIDSDKCIDCGKCRSSCPVNKEVQKNAPGDVYAFISKDAQNLEKSASGGAYLELAKLAVDMGGVAYGVAYDSEFNVIHTRATQFSEVLQQLSTKYVQSDLRDIYRRVKKDLSEGLLVVFSGTACQIAGLYSFLGKDYGRLITVDLLCKGVPSPVVFKKYIEYLKEHTRGVLAAFDFRSKRYGWGYLTTTTTTTGEVSVLHGIKGSFIRSCGLGYVRESCFSCAYTDVRRCSDITLGDFWRIEHESDLDVSRGCSAVICNTDKGREYVGLIPDAVFRKKTFDDLKKGQSSSLTKPIKKPASWECFFSDLPKMPFGKFANKYLVDRSLYGRLRDYVPATVRARIKKLLSI